MVGVMEKKGRRGRKRKRECVHESSNFPIGDLSGGYIGDLLLVRMAGGEKNGRK